MKKYNIQNYIRYKEIVSLSKEHQPVSCDKSQENVPQRKTNKKK